VPVIIKDATLHFGDCFDVLPRLQEKSVQLVLCDLPYGTTRNKWDSQLDLQRLWVEYDRVCDGAVVLTAQTPFDKVLGASNLANLRYEWIWEKGNATGHLNANRAPLKAHENALVFYQSQPTYNPQMTSGHARKTTKRSSYSANYGDQRETSYDSTQRYPRSVLFFSADKQKSALHPTQKPVDLMEYLIRTYTNPGDTVLDNCMGSGTTGVACANTSRKFIGIEIDEGYFEIACKRIRESTAAEFELTA
jgi:DNA modification methylase